MRLALLSTALLLLAPAAQAQSWTQLLGDLPGYSATLATRKALHVDEQGGIHVQTAQANAAGARVGRLYALNGGGALLPQLSTQITLSSITTARAVDARDGYRLSWYEYGTQPLIFFFDPGQATHDRAMSFGSGVTLSLLASDGNDNALIVYDDPASSSRPRVALFGSNPFIRWSRLVGGCPSNDNLPAKVLAAEYATIPVPHIAVVSRCDALPVQGGGRVMIKQIDPVTGTTLAVRYGMPYPGSDPAVAAYAVGGGRFVIEQADPVSGDRRVYFTHISGAEVLLPMPASFRLQGVVRSGDAALIPTLDSVRGGVGLLQFGSGKADWIEYPEFAPPPGVALSWGVSADGSGAGAVAYKEPQTDQRGPVQVYTFDGRGFLVDRRVAATLPTLPQGRIELAGSANGELLLAVDVERPDGRAAVHLEQFSLEGGIGTIPVDKSAAVSE